MASTIRHNRQGMHSVQGMSNIVFSMLDAGMSDSEICNELGMEAEELIKLKHITGFSKLFEDVEYRRAWGDQEPGEVEEARERTSGTVGHPNTIDYTMRNTKPGLRKRTKQNEVKNKNTGT